MEEKKEEHKHEHHALHYKPEANSSKLNLYAVFVGLAIVLVLIIAFNIALSFGIYKDLREKVDASKETAKPAKIDLAVIKDSKCADCSDISPYISLVKSGKVNVTGEKTLELDSGEARQLIGRYGIQKVPAIIITGETDKAALEGFEKKEDALVFLDINPPYTNTADGRVEGRVTMFYLFDPSCKKCGDLAPLISQIKFSGIRVVEQKNISIEDSEGLSLAQKYHIQFAPSIILSKDAGVYQIMQQAWQQIGSKEDDAYVLRAVYPPFINLTTKEIKGLVSITYLTDKSCGDCHNASSHKAILASPQSFAMTLDKEETVDVSDAKGKELIARYNITQVPTVILSRDADVYPSSQGLKQFFSTENDGSYVFRKPEVLGNYKDLATNEVVRPQAQQ